MFKAYCRDSVFKVYCREGVIKVYNVRGEFLGGIVEREGSRFIV